MYQVDHDYPLNSTTLFFSPLCGKHGVLGNYKPAFLSLYTMCVESPLSSPHLKFIVKDEKGQPGHHLVVLFSYYHPGGFYGISKSDTEVAD